MQTETDWFRTPIARHIWETRYRLVPDHAAAEASIEQTWQRVARTLAAIEHTRTADRERQFLELLRGFRFLPGGRILAGAGSGQRVTLFNCFVMGHIRDDLDGIFDALREGALTMQAGGGIGYDFSTLRPAGSAARASGRIASGPVAFMRVWDAMCDTVLSTGARRGAMMASLRCDHPDIEAFIDAKRAAGQLRHFNLSVQVSDAFMQAVADAADWPLLFPLEPGEGADCHSVLREWPGYEAPVACRVHASLPARELWERLMRAAYETAEPGVLFVDRINAGNNLAWRETIHTTNPCGEIPLPPYGACNLGSLNLTAFVQAPFTAGAALDLDALAAATRVATRLLDNVIDCSGFPLPQQAEQARGSRRLGLGITGLADALIMLDLHYASAAARETAVAALRTICHTAYRTSIALAREKGSFPYFERDAYLAGRFVRTLPDDIRSGIARYGMRNSHLTAIAPTGTISLLANNVSSGVEPVFALRYDRRVLDRDGSYRQFQVEDHAWQVYRAAGGDTRALPAAFVSAHALPPQAHLDMQAALQPYVDNAISKTINVPEDYPFAAFRELYGEAFRRGLKGCTLFRPNPVRGAVLDLQTPGTAADLHCCSIEREGG
ncbi:MAG: adenosylcobalamin-dependent ribonucleoside-diphosphate reductase [Pseudomonadota bacterium]